MQKLARFWSDTDGTDIYIDLNAIEVLSIAPNIGVEVYLRSGQKITCKGRDGSFKQQIATVMKSHMNRES